MYLLLIDLYELGQFLRIVAWIFIPLLLLITLITALLHRRKKRLALAADIQLDGPSGEDPLPAEVPEEGNSPYKGLLWMKRKYEQYRDDTDLKMEKIKEELATAEKKYLDLLASRPAISSSANSDSGIPTASSSDPASPDSPFTSPAPSEAPSPDPTSSASSPADPASPDSPFTSPALPEASPSDQASPDSVTSSDPAIPLPSPPASSEPSPLDQRINNYHQLEYQVFQQQATIYSLTLQLEEKQQLIDALTDRQADLIRLLTNIHKELNRSLNAEDPDLHEADHAVAPAFSE